MISPGGREAVEDRVRRLASVFAPDAMMRILAVVMVIESRTSRLLVDGRCRGRSGLREPLCEIFRIVCESLLARSRSRKFETLLTRPRAYARFYLSVGRVRMQGALSHEQVTFFRRAGYLRSSIVASQREIVAMRDAISREIETAAEPLKRNRDGAVVGVRDLLRRDPLFLEFFSSPQLMGELSSLLGPNIELVLNRHNHATLNEEGQNEVRLHRDVLQWSRSVVTAILYLDAADLDNGCTRVLPTSHYLPFAGMPNNGGTWMDDHEMYATLSGQDIAVPMPLGGVLFLDSLVFHTVGLNTTARPRRSVAIAYHSVDELDPAAKDHALLVWGDRLYRGAEYSRPCRRDEHDADD